MKKFTSCLSLSALLLLGLASCGSGSSEDVEYIPVQTTEDGAWHFMNQKGEIVGNQEWEFQPTVTMAGIFTVQTNEGYSVYKWDGKEAVPIDSLQHLVSVGIYSEGLLPVTPSMQRIRVVNKKGDVKFILEPKDGQEISSCAGIFQNGMLVVTTMDGKSGAVNNKGEWVISPKYNEISNFNDGYALAADYHYDDSESEGPTYYVLSKEGAEIKVEGTFGYPEGECISLPEFVNGVVSVLGQYDTEKGEYVSYDINTKGEVTKNNEDSYSWSTYLNNGGKITSVYNGAESKYVWTDKDGKVVMETTDASGSLSAYGNYVTLNKDNNLTIFDDKGKELCKYTGDYYVTWPGGNFGLLLQTYNREKYTYDNFTLLDKEARKLETQKIYGVGYEKSVNSIHNSMDEGWECEGDDVTSAYVDITAAASKLVSMITSRSVSGKGSYYIGESVKDILEGESVQYMSGKNFSIPTPAGKYYLATGAGFNIDGQINASADIVSPTYKQYFEVHHYDYWGRAWGWNRKKQVGVHVNPSAKVVSFDIILRTNHPSGASLKEAIGRRLKKDGYTLVNSGDNFEEYSNNYNEAIVYGSAESKGVGVLIGDEKSLKMSDSAKSALATKI